MGYRNHEGYPDPTQGNAINGVRKEEIQRMREKQHNLKRGEVIRIRDTIDTPDGKKTKTMEVTVKELYPHCVLLEGKKWIPQMPRLLEIEKDKSVKETEKGSGSGGEETERYDMGRLWNIRK